MASPVCPGRLVLERHIGEHIRIVLRLGSASIDPKTALRSPGFGSLLPVELRARPETSRPADVPLNGAGFAAGQAQAGFCRRIRW
jgi:hypothetical protein